MTGAIDGGSELGAGLRDLPELREAEDLESAGVGEDRAIPAHEAMKPAELLHEVVSRPEEEMVRIGENDLGAGRAEVVRPQRLHRRVRADRHEDWRFDDSVGGRESAGARRAVGGEKLELHRISVASP